MQEADARHGRARPARRGGGPSSVGPSSFTSLTQEVQRLGLMRRRYAYYWPRLVIAVLAPALWVAVMLRIGDSWWQLAWAAVLAVVLTQVAFLGHDAAHRQIFRSGRWNDGVSLVLANLVVGISHGWWRGKHTRHHANPNRQDHDPDIRSGALAFTPAAAHRARSRTVRWLVSHQGWYFFPLTVFEGLSLHWDGVRRVAVDRGVERRWVEAGIAHPAPRRRFRCFSSRCSRRPRPSASLAVQLGLFGFYLGCAFAPNHIGMPLVPAALRLDFLRRQVLVSRNIRGGRAVSIAMGGLNHQIEHHLFPSMSRPHLRTVAPLVVAHCGPRGCPTPRRACGRHTDRSSGTSTQSGWPGGTSSCARWSRSAAWVARSGPLERRDGVRIGRDQPSRRCIGKGNVERGERHSRDTATPRSAEAVRSLQARSASP